MARLVSKFFFLAALAVLLFITCFAFFDSLPRNPYYSYDLTPDPLKGKVKDESLQGANVQKPALAPAPTYIVSEVVQEEKKPEEEKKEMSDEERKKKEEEEKKKQEEENQRKQEDERRKKEKEEMEHRQKKGPPKVVTGNFDIPKDMVHHPSGPEPHEIVLLAASDGKGHNGGISNILGDITPNRKEYADFHGYHYHFINISKYDIGGAHPVWAKLPAIVETFNTFPQAKWVWWLDLDAIIMTPTVDLRTHILSEEALSRKIQKDRMINKSGGGDSGIITLKEPKMSDIDLIISQDQNGLNAGSFWLRRSEWTKILIDFWSDPLFVAQNWEAQEQDALMHVVKEHPTILSHMAMVRQREFNAYPVVNVPDMAWEEGDLAVHIAGCWVNKVCNDQWIQYMAKRVTVEQAKAKEGKKDEARQT